MISSSRQPPAGRLRILSRRFATALSAALLSLAVRAPAEELIPHRQDQPPNRPYSPEEAIARMRVPPGFTVELVAAEPDIVNPVAMTFDDRGRIFVCESIEYPRKTAGPGRDQVKLLEDLDGDGRAERVTVFAEGLNIPSGIAAGHGGIWLLNAPDLLFLREADGKEAGREVVVTGFGRTDTHELPSSLTWGPDGWLYGLNGVFNHSRVVSEGRTYTFTCALFRVDPRSRRFEIVCEGTSNPWGLAWDAEGSAIASACHWAKDHLFHFVETGYYQRQAGPYPPYTLKIGSITDHGHQKTAYCGLAWLDSDAYPEAYRERLYMGNVHGNAINVDRLERDGSTYRALAEPDFLAAGDAWFLPVSQKVGPDGCLYILDWYDRYHCYQDALRDPEGVDRLRGRLYRVRYGESQLAPRFDLAQESDEELMARLSSPNIFFRERAQRLLQERSGAEARRRLAELVRDGSAGRKARLHALWALIGGGPLPPDLHLELLSHADPTFRAWAVRAAAGEQRIDGQLLDAVRALSRDAAPAVQLEVAIAARKLEGAGALPLLLEVLARAGEDKLIPAIVWPNLHPLLEDEAERFVALLERYEGAAPVDRLLPRAVERLLGRKELSAAPVVELLSRIAERSAAPAPECFSRVAVRAAELSEEQRGALRGGLEPLLRRILGSPEAGRLLPSTHLLAARLGLEGLDAAAVRRAALDASLDDPSRLEAFDALIAFGAPELPELAGELLAQGGELAGRILFALGRSDEPRIAAAVLARFEALSPELQPLAIDLLLQRAPWTRRLLEAVRSGKMARSVLDANHLRKILDGNDREAIWEVERVWGSVRAERNPEREAVVAAMERFLHETPGDPLAGEEVFRRQCAQCHVIHGEGKSVGPDLTAGGRASFAQLVASVFDPSLVIGPGYEVTSVVTRDGRHLSGLLIEDGESRLVLRLAGGGEEAVPRGEVRYTQRSALSMMPEGLESVLAPREIADLFAFLAFDRHPRDPLARLIPGAPAR
jgi:putative heme-binding domain-containing protein